MGRSTHYIFKEWSLLVISVSPPSEHLAQEFRDSGPGPSSNTNFGEVTSDIWASEELELDNFSSPAQLWNSRISLY